MVPPLRPIMDEEVVEKEKTINAVEEEASDSGSENLDGSLERSETIPVRGLTHFFLRSLSCIKQVKKAREEVTYPEDDNKKGVNGDINKTNGAMNIRSPLFLGRFQYVRTYIVEQESKRKYILILGCRRQNKFPR